jgi:hypothetical protein
MHGGEGWAQHGVISAVDGERVDISGSLAKVLAGGNLNHGFRG